MVKSTRLAGFGDFNRRWGCPFVFMLLFIGLAAPRARAQLSDDELGELASLFGARSKIVEAVEKVGGRVEYDSDGPEKQIIGVDLSHTKLEDGDLEPLMEHLKKLSELSSLDLSGTGITDKGLVHLHALTALHMLKIAETKVTDEGVAAILQAMPKVHVSRRPRSLTYFPPGVFEWHSDDFLANWYIDPESEALLAKWSTEWYSEDLYAMKEPSLWSLSRDDPKAVAYRFLWLPAFRPPIAVRIVPTGNGAILQTVRLDTIGYLGGKPVGRKSIKLYQAQWAELKRCVEEARFWSLPPSFGLGGMDGDDLLLEGVQKGKYHVVHAGNSGLPDERYRRFKSICDEILRLSGLEMTDH